MIFLGGDPTSLLAQLIFAEQPEGLAVEFRRILALGLVEGGKIGRAAQSLLPRPTADAGLLELECGVLLGELPFALVVDLLEQRGEAFGALAVLRDLFPALFVVPGLLPDFADAAALLLEGAVGLGRAPPAARVGRVPEGALPVAQLVWGPLVSALGLEQLVPGEQLAGGLGAGLAGQRGQCVGEEGAEHGGALVVPAQFARAVVESPELLHAHVLVALGLLELPALQLLQRLLLEQAALPAGQGLGTSRLPGCLPHHQHHLRPLAFTHRKNATNYRIVAERKAVHYNEWMNK